MEASRDIISSFAIKVLRVLVKFVLTTYRGLKISQMSSLVVIGPWYLLYPLFFRGSVCGVNHITCSGLA